MRMPRHCLIPVARRLHRYDIVRFCRVTYRLGLLGGLRERVASRA